METRKNKWSILIYDSTGIWLEYKPEGMAEIISIQWEEPRTAAEVIESVSAILDIDVVADIDLSDRDDHDGIIVLKVPDSGTRNTMDIKGHIKVVWDSVDSLESLGVTSKSTYKKISYIMGEAALDASALQEGIRRYIVSTIDRIPGEDKSVMNLQDVEDRVNGVIRLERPPALKGLKCVSLYPEGEGHFSYGLHLYKELPPTDKYIYQEQSIRAS